MVLKKKFITVFSLIASICLLLTVFTALFVPAHAAEETTVYMQDEAVTKYGPADWNNDPGVEGGIYVPINETWVRHVEFTFTGTRISLIGTKASNTGKIKVSIDGAVVAESIDTNSETAATSQVLFRSDELASGSHTIKVETVFTAGVGEQYLNFESFRYQTGGGSQVSFELKEEISVKDDRVTLKGDADWHEDGDYMWCSFWPGFPRTASFSFSGNKFEIIGKTKGDGGAFTVTVDGAQVGSVDTLRAGEGDKLDQVLFSSDELADGTHTVLLSSTTEDTQKYISLKSFKVYTVAAATEEVLTESVNFADGRVVKKGDSDWTDHDDGSSHCGTWPGFSRTATFTFTGSRIEIIGYYKTDGESFTVAIDGVQVGNVDTKRTDLGEGVNEIGNQVLFTSAQLESGSHTIVLTTPATPTGAMLFLQKFNVYAQKGVEVEKEIRLKEVDEDSREITYTGDWSFGKDDSFVRGGYKSTSANNAKAEITFTPYKGGKAYVALANSGAAVKVKVLLDGTAIAEQDVSKYTVIATEELAAGEHTLSVERVSGGTLRLDCFYYQAEEIGTLSETKSAVDDSGFAYTGEFINQSGRYFSSAKGSTVTYTLSGAHIKQIAIMSKKHVDSATIKISLNDEVLEEALNLKVDVPAGENIPVYTIDGDALDPNATYTIKIEVVSERTDLYFEFYGLQVETYKQEADIDRFDYVLDTADTPADSEKVAKDASAKNIEASGFVKSENKFVSEEVGQKLTYRFRGVGFQILANRGENYGKFEVYLDGAKSPVAKVNTYADTAAAGVVVFHSGTLSFGVHTVEIRSIEEIGVNSTGRLLEITGFNVFKKANTDEDNLDPAYDDVTPEDYTLKENEEKKALAFNDKDAVSSDFGVTDTAWVDPAAGKQITVKFRGTGLEVVGDLGPDKGRVAIYVDGALFGNVNTYSAAPQTAQVLARLTDLGNTLHEVKIVILSEHALASSGNYIVVSGFNVIGLKGDVDKSQTLNNDHYSVTYDKMGLDEKSEYYGGDVRFSNQDGAYIQLQFRGTLLRIHGNKSSDGGVGSVYVDNEFYGTFNTRGQAFAPQSCLFVIKDLAPNKNHTVRIVIEGEYNPIPALAYISIDYFVVEDYADFLFEGYPEPPADADMGTLEPPVLVLRPSSDQEFIEKKSSGCGSSIAATGVVSAIVLLGAGVLLLRRKARK